MNRRCWSKKWNVNEGVVTNWATEGFICKDRHISFRIELAVSLFGLVWLSIHIALYTVQHIAYINTEKHWRQWEISTKLASGNGIKQFITNCIRGIKHGRR